MTLRDMLRTGVLHTQPYWPFSACYRSIYRLAIAIFARSCERLPDLVAAYVRSTLADGTWTAGSSDIDLTVVIRSGLPPDREYALLRELWARYFELRTFFPMLGELDVLEEAQLEAWLRYSRRTANPPERRVIAGRDVLAGMDAGSDDRWQIRALKDALWFYMDRLLPAMALPASSLHVHDNQRIARKILRLAGAAEEVLPSGSVELVRIVLSKLDEAVKNHGYVNPLGDSSVVFESQKRRFVIGSIIASDAAPPKDVVSLTPALFEFYVRQYDPAEYRRFATLPGPASGPDPLAGIDPPDQASCLSAALDQIPNVLLFPRSQDLFGPEPASDPERFARALRRVLVVLMALRGELDVREDPFTASRRKYPHAYDEIRKFDSPGTTRAAYDYFREFAAEVLAALDTSDFQRPAKTGSR